jgi:hypothetical protein
MPILRNLLQQVADIRLRHNLLHLWCVVGGGGWCRRLYFHFGVGVQKRGPACQLLLSFGVISIKDKFVELWSMLTSHFAGLLIETELLHDVLIFTHLVLHLLSYLLLLLVFFRTTLHALQLGCIGQDVLAYVTAICEKCEAFPSSLNDLYFLAFKAQSDILFSRCYRQYGGI